MIWMSRFIVDSNIKKTQTGTPGIKNALGNLFKFLPEEQEQRMKWFGQHPERYTRKCGGCGFGIHYNLQDLLR